MTININSWAQLPAKDQSSAEAQIREIFFNASGRSFASAEQAEQFWQKWTSYYFKYEPQLFFLVWQDCKLMGYLSGCIDSEQAQEKLSLQIAYFSLFKDLFHNYPAHLHINVNEAFRGQGVGQLLMKHFFKILKANQITGVHIVTSPEARNVGFYKKLGFTFSEQRNWHESKLLFLGNNFGLKQKIEELSTSLN